MHVERVGPDTPFGYPVATPNTQQPGREFCPRLRSPGAGRLMRVSRAGDAIGDCKQSGGQGRCVTKRAAN